MRFTQTVLQIIPRLDAGGAERTTVEIAQAIVDAGGRALVAAQGGRLVAAIEKVGGEFFQLPLDTKNPVAILLNAKRLERLIAGENVDLVHARSRAPAWSASIAARMTKRPFVTTFHGAYEARSALKRFVNSSMVRGDIVIANSRFTADSIATRYPAAKNIRVIPRGADLEEFNPQAISEGRVASLRGKWPAFAPEKTLSIILPARLTSWKGHETAINAAAMLSAETGVFPPFQLFFIGAEQGRGAYAEELKRRVGELGLQGLISFVGHCDDMPAAYALADIVLSPSVRPEAFGRVAAEAGAMEKIAIASRQGGSPEIISEGETGFLTEPGDAAALATAIRQAAALGRSGRAAMGKKARQKIQQEFSIAAMKEATLAAYADALRDHGGER